jgi:hypothetical protein
MRTITMTAWKRPDLTLQVLESLSKCHKVENYKLLAFVEPGCDQVVEAFNKFNACEKQIVINSQVMGIAENTKQALNAAFEQGEYNIHIEDDTVLLPNALNFFEWCDEKFKDDQQIGTCCAFSSNTSESLPSHVIAHRWFGCWAWSTWKTRWEHSLKNEWGGDMRRFAANVNGWQFKNRKLQIYPIRSLCINIGIGDNRATNGKNELKREINANESSIPVISFELVEQQETSNVIYTDEGMSPSESVICIQFCNKVPNTATKLYGCEDSILKDHLIITGDAVASQAIFNYDAFPNNIHDAVIIIGIQKEKIEFLTKNGYTKQHGVNDKCGVERWIKK